ncbi:hypothetical protein VTI74DRAFT_2737 [Chaetomium olivicolor]
MAALALPEEAREEVVRVYKGAFVEQVMAMTVVAGVGLVLSLGMLMGKGGGRVGEQGEVVGVMVQHKEGRRRMRRGDGRGEVELSSDSRKSGEAERGGL